MIEKELSWDELFVLCDKPKPKKEKVRLKNEDEVLDWELEKIWFEKNRDLK